MKPQTKSSKHEIDLYFKGVEQHTHLSHPEGENTYLH